MDWKLFVLFVVVHEVLLEIYCRWMQMDGCAGWYFIMLRAAIFKVEEAPKAREMSVLTWLHYIHAFICSCSVELS